MLVPASILEHVRGLLTDLASDSEKTSPLLASRVTMTAAVVSSNSAYREIRAAFRAEDDVDAPAGTVRAWFLGQPLRRETLSFCLKLINCFRHRLGCRHCCHQPVLPSSLAHYYHLVDRRSDVRLSHGEDLGEDLAQSRVVEGERLRVQLEPVPMVHQGTNIGDYHGQRNCKYVAHGAVWLTGAF